MFLNKKPDHPASQVLPYIAGRRHGIMHSGVRALFFFHPEIATCTSTCRYLNLGHLFPRFPRVTPEPGLQCHVSFKVGLCHVLSRPPPEEHDLRLLRRALSHGRYCAVSHAKNGLSTKGLPFFRFFKFVWWRAKQTAFLRPTPPYKFKESKNGRTLVERPFLREKRLSNAQERGRCEANGGHAPRGMVC